ncbi:MAG: hypothetical protein NT027_11325, partial [Proteobacteria bacterium]|nr:hypothetical protein [Pseudomonadota bacterium]
ASLLPELINVSSKNLIEDVMQNTGLSFHFDSGLRLKDCIFGLIAFCASVLLVCCKTPQSKDGALKIVSSKAVRSVGHPSVRLLKNHRKNTICTAIFLSPRGALTAGHCLPDAKFQGQCGVSIDGVEPANCFSAVYRETDKTGKEVGKYDMAFLVFSRANDENALHPGGFKRLDIAAFSDQPFDFRMEGYGEHLLRQGVDGTLTPIEGDLTGIEGDLTGIEGDLTGIEGDLTGIEGDLTGIEGDLTGIEGDLTGIGGTANNGSANSKIRKITGKLFACESRFTSDAIQRNLGSNTFRIRKRDSADHCMPSRGDSGSPLLSSSGKLLGMAVLASFKGDDVVEAVYIKMSSATFDESIDEALKLAGERQKRIEVLRIQINEFKRQARPDPNRLRMIEAELEDLEKAI